MKSIVCFILLGFAVTAEAKQPPTSTPTPDPADVFEQISRSHIDGNIPDRANFEKFLKRDLIAYFARNGGKNVTVETKPLRNGPTQSGVSYPKFCLWVRVFQNKKPWQTGAVRVAAIDKKEFEVTTFLTLATLRSNRAAIYQTFPKPVGDKIVNEYLKR